MPHYECPYYVATSQLICTENQLICFYDWDFGFSGTGAFLNESSY